MGLVMSPGTVVSQLDSMNENLQQAVSNAKIMLININNFRNTEDNLKGKSYDNIRDYYGTWHVPILNMMIQYTETMIQENNAYKGCISSYLSGIGFVDEDALKRDKEFLVGQINQAYNLMTISKASTSSLISSLEHALELVEKKLLQINNFMSASASIYGGMDSLIFSNKGFNISNYAIYSVGAILKNVFKNSSKTLFDEKVECGKQTLMKYLEAHGITDPKEQQKIISMFLQKDLQGMLVNLYITDCYSSVDANIIFNEILNYYNRHKNDITMEDVESLTFTENGAKIELTDVQKETFVECWNMFSDMGLSQEQIIGAMANLYAEGRYSSTNAQDGKANFPIGEIDDSNYVFNCYDGIGYGIAQWTYYSRKEGLRDMATNMNGNVSDLDVQLAYLRYELEEGDCKSLYQEFLKTETVYDATYYYMDSIENPQVNNTNERMGFAKDIENWLNDLND